MENKNKYIMLLSLATAAVIFLVLVTIFTYINSPNPDTYTPATRAVCGIIAFILIVLFFKIPEELNYKVMDFHLETPKYEQEMYDEASMQIFSIILILLMNIYFFVVFNTVPSSGVFFGICIGSTFRLFVKTRKYFFPI